ncbi:MAG: DHH family phosphoesterase [Candidatus Magasanikbacteria bacterium]
MPHRIAKQIHNEIQKLDNFLLVAHQNPDGDAASSISAFSQMLEQLDKKYTLFCKTSVSKQFEYLKNIHLTTSDPAIWNKKYGAIIVFDSGNLAYAGIDEFIKKQTDQLIINIDHHTSNIKFGQHNLVVDNSSSTAEVIYNYFLVNKIKINDNMATSLLTGLITDTDNFSNSATSKDALSMASYLINKGARFKKIHDYIIMDKNVAILKLWGIVLNRLEVHQKTNIAYTYIQQADLKKCEVTEEEIGGLSNMMNHLKEGKAVFVFKEKTNGNIKASTRTTLENVDLAKIAQLFGGGGHKKAAGFEIPGPIESALKQVWSTIEKSNLIV